MTATVGARALVTSWLCMAACDDASDAQARIEAAASTTPEDARGAWLRVTPEGLEALPAAWLASLDPAALAVALPPARHGDLSVCTSDECAIALRPERLAASPRADGSLGLSASVAAAATSIGVRYEQSWACAFAGRPECAIAVDTAGAPPGALSASARLTTDVDAATGLAVLRLVEPRVVHGLDGGDVRIAGANACGHVWCSLANAIGAQRWIADEANRALLASMERELERRACVPCAAAGGGCPDGTRCDAGVCRRPDRSCAPLPLAAAATVPSRDGRARATVGLAVADEVGVRRGGLEAALRLAAHADRRHPCVPAVEQPPRAPVPRDLLEREPESGVHLRAVIGHAAIARALWALHQAGVGCVDVGPEQVAELDATMLAIVLPSSMRLDDLGLDAPSVAVRPLRPPSVRIEPDGALAIEATDMRMEIWADVDGRALRLAAATLEARALARLAERDGRLAVEIPLDAITVDVASVWSAPILGAGEAELRETFETLSLAAIGVVPEEIVLDGIPFPGRISLVAVRPAAYDGGTALVVDLRVSPAR